MPNKSIAIACDHAGYELKSTLMNELESQGYSVVDLGTNGDESVDYPDFAFSLAAAIDKGQADQGVLVWR